MNRKLVVAMESFLNGIFDHVYIVAIIGAILVFITSMALSIFLFIYSKKLKEDLSQYRMAIISGFVILVVGFCGCGFLILLSIIFK
ncbi:hypothetical protein ACSFCE_15110 [Staphylococcus shinii]